jgi:hypothetical protein
VKRIGIIIALALVPLVCATGQNRAGGPQVQPRNQGPVITRVMWKEYEQLVRSGSGGHTVLDMSASIIYF